MVLKNILFYKFYFIMQPLTRSNSVKANLGQQIEKYSSAQMPKTYSLKNYFGVDF